MPGILYDITRPLGPWTPVWPGDAPCRLLWTQTQAEGAGANVGEICLSTHCGTHVDAPYHVDDSGVRVGALPVDAFVGPAVVIEAGGSDEIDPGRVEGLLERPGAERVLFRTACWSDAGAFPERFPALSPELAGRLVAAGVRLVGTDAPSVDSFHSTELPAHRILARAGIPILENLRLDGVPPGLYELIALPLRLETADASPVRAVLRSP